MSSSSTNIWWYPHTDKSASLGPMDSSTIHQQTQEKCHPPTELARGIQTSVLVVDPSLTCGLSPGPLGHVPRSPRKHHLRQSLTDDRAFVELWVSNWEIPAYFWSKKYKFGWTEESKRYSMTLPASSFFWGNTARANKDLSPRFFPHRG